MHRGILLIFLSSLFLLGCGNHIEFSEFRPLENGRWARDDVKEFKTPELNAEQSYDMYINIRNDHSFPYSNLFLITELESPEGETVRDTLEYVMAEADGTWLGKGYGSIKENKLWYKENINLPVSGVYTIRIEQAMRKNGNVEGLSELQGITDVGLEIERH
ncbi:protein involved in gliding motility GldH [Muriicola jejuensis]|uniref:Gliding motility lipoprotein GldH n=1 Tax=Muriicola jejuensis TaxID=504488 RepID=A0A6P0UDR2_9FLAO|nr:gliding motility lipoprotein GldH [Muriicola jejuensis]NER09858.1 gliding motility lipoprotein GldH [Muriicola jejuensis]SMP05146.1 protein involved in gliding motility GldH [Muriicola jejuensis]